MKPSLDEIVANKRQELASRQRTASSAATTITATDGVQRMMRALNQSGTRIIAEIKPRSPSAGELNLSVDLAAITRSYSNHAAAISVLTDQKYFGGSMEALAAVAAQSKVPVLCKEFILDPVQLHDATAAGAAAALLIVKILDERELAALRAEAKKLGLAAVVEVQNEDELQRALAAEPDVLLINNRNLSTYEIDLDTTAALAALIPKGQPFISASGIESRADIEKLSKYTNKFLIGSSLMTAADPDAKLRELCGS